MIKVNFYGGPGSGKSTLAALLFAELKTHQLRTELVREFAKELVYQGEDLRDSGDNLQLIIFAEQLKRELLVKSHVDVLISDSPLFLNAYYSKSPYILEVAKNNNKPKDLHVWIERDPNEKFENDGRSHTENQSKKIDRLMKDFLTNSCQLKLISVKGTAKEKSSYLINKILREIR